MVLVNQRQYDGGSCSSCGSGGGQPAFDILYVNASTTRVTEYLYDWRGRKEIEIPPADDEGRTVYTQTYYDNLDRAVSTEQYHEQTVGDDILIARTENFIDDRGHTYYSRRYAVNAGTGEVGPYLAGYTWFDAAGNAIKQHSPGERSFTKTAHDSLGRGVKQYVGYDLSESPCVEVDGSSSSSSSSSSAACGDYSTATNVTGDTIFEQTETDYDDAGNVIETRLRRRHHDATGTGELTTPAGAQPRARVGYAASYIDPLGRDIATANYGTNGDAALTRSDTVPTRSDTVLVSSSEYNNSGEQFKSIDPVGKEDLTFLDDAGRVTKTIENYTDGDPTTGNPDEDRTVEFTYTADGQQATITAKQQSSSDDQTTTYVHGTTLDDSQIARSDLLRAEIYPDSDNSATGFQPVFSNGPDGVYDRIEYTYNRQGQRLSMKDQNGSVHQYEYNALGRPLHDRITTLALGVDGAVRRISTTYNVRGNLERATSYDHATVGSGNVVNEVLREYNDFGLLEKEYQEHDGSKDGNTPYVGYEYDETALNGEIVNGLRPTSLRYPNGRLVHYTYGTADSAADVFNRLNAIRDDDDGLPGDVLASYKYLGLDQIVIEDFEEPDVRLEYFFDSAYSGFDRFGRLVDQRWYDYGAGEDRDRYQYSYDRGSHRTYRANLTTSANDEFYTYDGLYQLKTFDRGELNATKTGITGTPVREEDWGLDMIGNWSNYIQKSSGTTDLDQDRAHNKVNEITDITETTGPSWVTPAYDRNGNTTTIPKPAALDSGLTLKFDGWNRLTEIKDGSTVIGRYEYDALNRRVKRHVDSDALSSLSGIDAYMHYFFSKNWQVLGRRDTTTENDQPENLQPKYQYLWSPRYIDAPVLRDENTDDDGMCDDGRIYYLGDANFNLTTLVDTAGDAAERYYYESYGGVTIRDGSWTTSLSGSGHDNQIMFSGRERDGESRLYHIRARMYQTGTGRWLSVDPLSFAGGINRFCYVDNNPVMFIDPSGRVTFWNDYSRGNDDLVEPNYQTAQIRVTLMVGVSACKHFENDPGGLLGPFLATPCCVGRVSAKLCYKAVAVSSPRAALFLDPIFAHGELFLKYKGRRVPCDYSSVGDDVAGSYYSCCVPLGEYTCVGDRANGTATIFSTARWHWNDWLPRRLSGHTYQTIDFSFAISACGNVRNPQLRLNQPGRPGYRQSDLLRLTGSNFILGPHIEPHPTG